MNSRVLLGLTLTCFLAGCSDKRSPTAPDPTLNNLTVESVSSFITLGDYRVYSVRVRVRETSATPVIISTITLQFLGDGAAVTRTFSNVARNSVAPNASVELDDLHVADEQRQLDSAKTILATVAYAAAGQTGAATGLTDIPNCAVHFRIGGSDLIDAGQTGQLGGTVFQGCSSGVYVLTPTVIQWRTLNPDVAVVNASGVVTGVTNGLATIQGTYGNVVSSHKVRVGPLVGPPAKVIIQGARTARPGQTFRYYMVAEWPDGIRRELSDAAQWQSSSPTVATVSARGDITAGSDGIVAISATYLGVSDTVILKVSRVPDSVQVRGPVYGMKVGETYGFAALGLWEVPDTFDVRRSSEWRSSLPAVATVDSQGEVTARSAGTSEISATYNGVTGGFTLVVHPD